MTEYTKKMTKEKRGVIYECKKVVSDIFGEIEFVMECENIGL